MRRLRPRASGRARERADLTPAGLAVAIAVAACEPTNQGYAPDQPVTYSHAVHAGAFQIPCMYCHFGADRGRYAGIPPAQVCMSCHTQVLKDNEEVGKVKKALETGEPIAWVRVHRLPDYVFFDHNVHVHADVACQTCHGPVETMGRVTQWAPLTMGWCLDCHRQLGSTSPSGQPVTTRANRLTDCSVCHH